MESGPHTIEVLGIDEFLVRRARGVVCDVRTPAEYARGHVAGATNLPLFTDADRAEVGILYKQSGRHAALLRSLDLVAPRARPLVEDAKRLGAPFLYLYCWRGGMRSAAVGQLLHFFGQPVALLRGGYKAYRRRMAEEFGRPFRICLIGGKTGSGKTELLCSLREAGEQVVDLERLAGHRGSAFGGIGLPPQPSQEQFENGLGEALYGLDPGRRVWLEDESRLIGQCQIPAPFWERMRPSPVFFLDIDEQARLSHVVEGYRDSPVQEVLAAIGRIQRRLGGDNARLAEKAVAEGDVVGAARILLAYYDRGYVHALSRRPPEHIVRIESDAVDTVKNTRRLIAAAERVVFSEQEFSGWTFD